jgi:hypothetical protein
MSFKLRSCRPWKPGLGAAEARRVLKTLAQGMREARITRDANASLERLTERFPTQKP